MDQSIRPARGVRLYYLDDAGVLFSESAQELHLLNTMAAVIWTLLEEGHDARETVAALQDMYALDEARARDFVSSALAQWRRSRLVEERSGAPATPAIVPPPIVQPTGGAWREFIAAEERHYRLLSSRLTLRFSSEARLTIRHGCSRSFEVRPTRATHPGFHISIFSRSRAIWRESRA